MQTLLTRIAFLITCFFMSMNMNAQVTIKHEKYNPTIDSLRQTRQRVEVEEKEKLKLGIEALQERLKADEISIHEFESEKKILAEKHAQNIQSRTLILDESIDYLKRNEGEDNSHSIHILLGAGRDKDKNEKVNDTTTRYASKQSSGLFLAVGFSNTVGDNHSLNDTPYKMAGSRFFEIGYNWRTALNKRSSLHLRYGLGLHIDGYKPTDNQYFVLENKQLHLEEYPLKLNKSKLRSTNLVVPIHFEYKKPKLTVRDNGKKVYSYYNAWGFGIGGYAGMNLKTIQKLKFKENGSRQRTKENMSSGVNQAVYGLSAYVGKGPISLYARYALSDMFRDVTYNEKTVALGLRYAY